MVAIDETKDIPGAIFESLETDMNKEVQPILDIVQRLEKEGKPDHL
jgi:hypothetical protein